KKRTAQFAKDNSPGTPESFPPPLQPNSISTLGELRSVTGPDGHNRLLVLGGLGNSGSAKTGIGQPSIQHYANNDGWFDDTSDGPVRANLVIQVSKIDGHPAPPNMSPQTVPVDVPAWVITGYPRYAPQIVDIVTMDDLVYDLAVRNFNYAPAIYKDGEWNNDYYPYFWRDIWPIPVRPFSYQFVADIDPMNGGDPHETGKGSGGNMDPDQLSAAPWAGSPAEQENHRARRGLIWKVLRKAGQENALYAAHPKVGRILFAMPLLCGDNPLSNDIVSKFLRLTDTQLFLIKQWAEGKF